MQSTQNNDSTQSKETNLESKLINNELEKSQQNINNTNLDDSLKTENVLERRIAKFTFKKVNCLFFTSFFFLTY